MTTTTRRTFLGVGAGIAAGALAACGGGGGTGGPGGPGLRWWDHFSALQKFHKDWAAKLSTELGAAVSYTYNDASKSAEALQLANQSKQLPDVYSNTLGIPLAALVREGWVHEITISDEAKGRLPEGSLTDGVTSIDGKLYGLPLFSSRQYSTATWFNRDLITAAGLDPAKPPTTYDEFRAACQKVTAAGGAAALMLALGDPGRMRDQVDDLAQAAGFPGYQGTVFTTGEYAYHDDAYVTAIEFWKELADTGALIQGASNFTVANARTRWASGAAGFFPDGPWCAGGAKTVMADFVPKIEVGPMLKPDASSPGLNYRNAPGAQFFIAGTSADVDRANKIIESMTTPEYQQGLTAGMDQPPLDLDTVETADVIEPYRRVVSYFKEVVFRAPQAVIRNPEVAAVQAEAKPVNPHLGNIIQGYLGGDVTDLRAALRKLSGDMAAERERAVKAAADGGAEVSLDDYAFPDWKPGADYDHG